MPPPRPRGLGTNTGVPPNRLNPNTPMSERQQMALLIQMTSSAAEYSKSTTSKKIEKKVEDTEEMVFQDKHDAQEEIYIDKAIALEFSSDTKQDQSNKRALLPSECGSSNLDGTQMNKRHFSDLEDEKDVDIDDDKRKKKKDFDNKDIKTIFCNRIPIRLDKSSKHLSTGSKSSLNIMKHTTNISGEKERLCESPKNVANRTYENDIDSDEFRTSENIYSGGLKVPPLKIVIPSQNISMDIEGNVSRSGKVTASRNSALPYVVTTNSETNERDNSSQSNSPDESPIKNCSVVEEKMKSGTEDKSLHRVLRSSHRANASNIERTSNNSSPQLQSNSPSPASSTTNETTENKISSFPNTASPLIHQGYEAENIANLPSPSTSSTSSSKEVHSTVDLHPRKRKIKIKQDEQHFKIISNIHVEDSVTSGTHPHDFPFTNCFHMYLNIRKQIEKKHKLICHIKPRPPQGYGDYLIKKRSYALNGNSCGLSFDIPNTVSCNMRDIFIDQQKERHELSLRHTVEREKLSLNVEQEILRVHTKAARSISSQPVPFSACTLIRDEEIYNMITPEQEEKDRNARYRFNGRLLLSWLQDVDDKWEKIKDAMVLRHHNEAESLHAVQLMNWEIALKQREHCVYNASTNIEELHVPIVHVTDDFDLLPE